VVGSASPSFFPDPASAVAGSAGLSPESLVSGTTFVVGTGSSSSFMPSVAAAAASANFYFRASASFFFRAVASESSLTAGLVSTGFLGTTTASPSGFTTSFFPTTTRSFRSGLETSAFFSAAASGAFSSLG